VKTHTPGPWTACDTYDGEFAIVAHSGTDDAEDVATVSLSPVHPNAVANAHLIAAAPVLYAALEAATEVMAETSNYLGPFDHAHMFGELSAAVAAARAALKRARGE